MSQASHKPLATLSLALIGVAGILSLRSLPMMAEYGLTAMTYYLLAAICFLIPSALMCAELATGWPVNGGMFTWVREGLGDGLGFMSMWLEWTNTIVWFPTVLSVIATTLAYALFPSMAEHKSYTFIVMLIILWGATWLNYGGIAVSRWVSSFGIAFGTLIPGLFIILLGLAWWLTGKPIAMDLHAAALWPNWHWGELPFLGGLIISYAGMQVAAFHAQDTENPQRDYPRGILLAVIIIIAISVLATLAIASVLPAHNISLVAGIMQTLSAFLTAFHLNWLLPVLGVLMVLGSIAALNTWLLGPSKGLRVAAAFGFLPKWMAKGNHHHAPTSILLIQAIVATLLGLVFLWMPSVNSSYWLLSVLTSQLTMLMYGLLFIALIRLRYTKPDVVRAYRIPGGKFGVWVVGLLGIFVSAFAFFVGFIPPAQLNIGKTLIFDGLLIGGLIAFALPAWFFYWHYRKHLIAG